MWKLFQCIPVHFVQEIPCLKIQYLAIKICSLFFKSLIFFPLQRCVTCQRISTYVPVARTRISWSGLHDIALMPLPTSPTFSISPDATFHNNTLPVSVATHTDCWSGRNSIPTILLTPSGGSSSHWSSLTLPITYKSNSK